jgi:hypothetical protein
VERDAITTSITAVNTNDLTIGIDATAVGTDRRAVISWEGVGSVPLTFRSGVTWNGDRGNTGTEVMRITSSGNVGIGTTSPGYKLDVNGDSRISGQAIIIGTATVQGNAFSVGGSTFVVNAGNVGIGKSNPSYKLDIVGDVNITGNYRINGNPAGLGDAVLSATQTWTGGNTYNNNTIFNSSITINANPNQQYALVIDTNNNPSDGYVVSVNTNGVLGMSGVPYAVSTAGKGVIYYSSTQNKFLKSENGSSPMPLADPLVHQLYVRFALDSTLGYQTVLDVSGSGVLNSLMFKVGNGTSSKLKITIDGIVVFEVSPSTTLNYVLFLTSNHKWCSTEHTTEPTEATIIISDCVMSEVNWGFKNSLKIEADGATSTGGVVGISYSLYQ